MKALFLAKPGFRILGNKDPDISNLIEILRGFSIVYTSGDLYDDCVKCNIHAFRLDLTKDEGDGTWSNEYVENINKMVSFAVDNIVDVYITAGGDGTVSYVASTATPSMTPSTDSTVTTDRNVRFGFRYLRARNRENGNMATSLAQPRPFTMPITAAGTCGRRRKR